MTMQFDRILLQCLMVILPVVLYSTLKKEKRAPKKESILWAVVCSAGIFLSVLFAVQVNEGIFLDMRMVPWLLSFLYGGNLAGIFVTVFFIIIRLSFGGTGMIPAFLVLLLCIPVVSRLQKRYSGCSRNKKSLMAAGFLLISTASIPIIGSILLEEPYTESKVLNYVFFTIANGAVGWISIHLMESYREKERLRDEVHHNEKMNLIGQLAASVAHEIRNPMTSVRGFIQLLGTADNINSEQKSYLQVCLDDLDRANEIITNYLNLGKSSDSNLVMLDISKEAIHSVKALSSYATLKGVNLSLQIAQSAMVFSSPGRVQQMFINIIKNAIEAVGPNGNVSIKQQMEKDKVVFLIKDDGVGMTPEQIKNLGLPYYSTKEKGTGFGIMVTAQVIKEMGGQWKIDSTLNRGTAFTLSFPLAKE